MTAHELSRALAEVRRVTDQIKLFSSLDTELSDVARAMLANQNKLPGVTLEDGRKRFALKEGVTLGALTEHLQTVLPRLNKEAFINQFGTVKAAEARTFLAQSLTIDESTLIERLQEDLQEKNPFFMKPDQPSVVVDPAALELAEPAEEEVTSEVISNRI